MKRTDDNLACFQSFGIKEWFLWDATFKQLTDSKVSQMTHFNHASITKLYPYFNDLKNCLTSLYNAVFSTRDFWNNTAEHWTMLNILQETYNKLCNEDLAILNEESPQVSSHMDVALNTH